MPINFRLSFSGSNTSFFKNNNKRNKDTTVNSILYHTSSPSFKVINLPKTPVNPQRKTAICNLINAGFMGRNNLAHKGSRSLNSLRSSIR